MYSTTTAYRKLQTLNRRIRGISGGTSASKTISILQWLIDASQNYKGNLISSIVSESMPHLKRGVIRDFLNIMQEHGYYVDSRWNRSDFIYDFSDKSGRKILEFFSADQPGKVRGPRRDILFINEANNISYETFTQLEIRTKKIVWLDWNPVSEFWFYTSNSGEPAVKDRSDCDFMILTYRDNEALDPASIQTIEMRKDNRNWWRVYGEGLLGESEGRIYKDWAIIDEIPHSANLRRYGLDFGYTNDPTALIAIYYMDGGYILDEVTYRKGLNNNDIADIIHNLSTALVIADSAEPKSIDEIKLKGIDIVPAQKGKGSVNQGIDYVQQQRISVTKQSVNLLKEYRNYLWITDKNGKMLNEPQDFLNHCMDATRYGLESFQRQAFKFNPDVGGVKPYYPGLPG